MVSVLKEFTVLRKKEAIVTTDTATALYVSLPIRIPQQGEVKGCLRFSTTKPRLKCNIKHPNRNSLR